MTIIKNGAKRKEVRGAQPKNAIKSKKGKPNLKKKFIVSPVKDRTINSNHQIFQESKNQSNFIETFLKNNLLFPNAMSIEQLKKFLDSQSEFNLDELIDMNSKLKTNLTEVRNFIKTLSNLGENIKVKKPERTPRVESNLQKIKNIKNPKVGTEKGGRPSRVPSEKATKRGSKQVRSRVPSSHVSLRSSPKPRTPSNYREPTSNNTVKLERRKKRLREEDEEDEENVQRKRRRVAELDEDYDPGNDYSEEEEYEFSDYSEATPMTPTRNEKKKKKKLIIKIPKPTQKKKKEKKRKSRSNTVLKDARIRLRGTGYLSPTSFRKQGLRRGRDRKYNDYVEDDVYEEEEEKGSSTTHHAFWKHIDSLFDPVFTEDKLKCLNNVNVKENDVVFTIPKLGEHYSKKWEEEDEHNYEVLNLVPPDVMYPTRSRRKNVFPLPGGNSVGQSGGHTHHRHHRHNFSHVNIEVASSVFEDGTLTQKLLSSMIEERVIENPKNINKKRSKRSKKGEGYPTFKEEGNIQKNMTSYTNDYTAENILKIDSSIDNNLKNLKIFRVEKEEKKNVNFNDELTLKIKQMQNQLKEQIHKNNILKAGMKQKVLTVMKDEKKFKKQIDERDNVRKDFSKFFARSRKKY